MFNKGNVVLTFISSCLLAPVIEEIMYRGLVLNKALGKMKVWIAIIVSVLIFGVIHMNLYQGIYATVSGIALGYVYVKTRSLWRCILGHFLINLFVYIQSIFFII